MSLQASTLVTISVNTRDYKRQPSWLQTSTLHYKRQPSSLQASTLVTASVNTRHHRSQQASTLVTTGVNKRQHSSLQESTLVTTSVNPRHHKRQHSSQQVLAIQASLKLFALKRIYHWTPPTKKALILDARTEKLHSDQYPGVLADDMIACKDRNQTAS